MILGNVKERKKQYVAALLCTVVMSYIFLNSFYWPYQGIGERKILVGLITLLMLIVLPVTIIGVDYFYYSLKNVAMKIEKNKKTLLFFGASLIFVTLIAYILAFLYGSFTISEFNKKIFYTLIAGLYLSVCVIFFLKETFKRIEILFCMFALILGVFSISITPARVGISWDDEIHYERALELSNVLNGVMYKADQINIEEYATNIYAHSCFDRTTEETYLGKLNESYEKKEIISREFTYYKITSITSIPSAMGIIFARGLGLSYVSVFNMGRLFNLLAYTVLICLAIKRVRYGKVLIATIGLIPTTIFMASSYSYDSWVTGFTVLGFSYFFAALQDEHVLRTRDIIMIVGAIWMGCLPKAIYFPILFPLLFMPRHKFKSEKQKKMYYIAIITAGVFLVATFLLPMFINGVGTGDARGGSAVNSTEQVKFILQYPVTYAKVLLKFLSQYFSIGSAGAMLERFAYVGEGVGYGTVSILLAVLAYLDRGQKEKNYISVKVTSLLGCGIAIILATTALYISFTAVGLDTIAGMQGRYLVPTIYPALYSIGVGGTEHKIDKKVFASVPMIVVALTFMYNMWVLCVKLY